MEKDDLKEKFVNDFDKMRGGLLEILSHNRAINVTLVEHMSEGDFSSLEEYTMLTKSINDSVKQLTDIYKQTPDILEQMEKKIHTRKPMNITSLLDNK